MSTKDEVHREYLSRIEELRNVPEPINHNVLVVGSDGSSNVGNAVAVQLRTRGVVVDEADEDDMEIITWGEYTDVVFCNAETHLDWIEDQPDEKIFTVVNNTLTASILYTKRFVDATIHNLERKRIVYVGSMAHNRVLNASAPYCAAKAGLAHFARCMAWELTPKGFVISTVHPGNISDTPMTRATIEGIMDYRGLDASEATDYWSSMLLTDRFLTGSDVGRVIVTALRAEPNMSGQQIELGGGLR